MKYPIEPTQAQIEAALADMRERAAIIAEGRGWDATARDIRSLALNLTAAAEVGEPLTFR